MNPHGFILPSRIVGILCMLIALFPAGFAISYIVSTHSLLKNASHAAGKVIDVKSTTHGSGQTYEYVYEFVDQSQTRHQLVTDWSNSPPSYRVGDPLEVLYRPSDPASARIDCFMSMWFGPVLCTGLTIGPVFFGLTFVWFVPFAIRRVWPTRDDSVNLSPKS